MRLLLPTLLAVIICTVRAQTPLDAVVQTLAETVDTLQARVEVLENRLNAGTGGGGQAGPSVAFLAQYSDDHPTGLASGPYVFDNAILNVGNSYDPATGVFTAPVSGIYLLGVQLFTDGGDSEHPFVDIKVNSNTVARLAFDEGDGQEDSDSTMITWRLNAGDKVWIASEEGVSYHYWGQYHTFFTGTLIATVPDAPATTMYATTVIDDSP